MAIVRPSLDELAASGAVNEGEMRTARALARLSDDWVVYVQARLGHDVPDFVAVSPVHGVCAIEVKDWARGCYRQTESGRIEHIGSDGAPRPIDEQPRYQAFRYRSTIFEQFFAAPDDGAHVSSLVRAAVVMPKYSTADARKLLERPQVTPHELDVQVWGGDDLEHRIAEIVGANEPHHAPPAQESLDRLRRLLTICERTTSSNRPPALSSDARNIQNNPSRARIRRVRGPAGCGKSFGLAARAARLAADEQSVLVLTFNTTLSNYLRTLINERCRETAADARRVTCTHFHGFCSRLVEDAKHAGIETTLPKGKPWFDAIVDQASDAIGAGFQRQFDAVLVDEGQDFTLDWWNFLRRDIVAPDGEMLLVADPTQDVFGKRAWTDEERMLGAGFRGSWTELKGSFRMPSDISPLAAKFAERYLGGECLSAQASDETAEIAGTGLATRRRWTNLLSAADLGIEIGHEVVRLLSANADLAPHDIVFLCDTHQQGREAVAIVEAAGFPVQHIFGTTKAEQKRRKQRFWPDGPGVKGCTVHSFKGWETPALVMGISAPKANEADDRSRRLAYVAMTRVRVAGHDRPAFISVVNADLGVAGFESTFTQFEPLRLPHFAPPAAAGRIS